MSPRSEKPSSHDPLADLDDDLGDDWESAFQAEDFMFSPEDEPSDFFLFDENAPDQNEDIASLFADQDQEKEARPEEAGIESTTEDEGEGAAVLAFPNRLQILAASLLQLFQSRPRHQRILIATLPVALIFIGTISLLLQPADEELLLPDHQAMVSEAPLSTAVPQGQNGSPALPQDQKSAISPPQAQAPVEIVTIQQKWQLPTFVIVASAEGQADLIINIDLTLTANLEKGQSLPDDKQTFVKDIIYQFYRNRPAYELKRFALARGEMISQLNAWLNKQWQGNPFDTVVFSRYQVVPISPSLAPKVTFL